MHRNHLLASAAGVALAVGLSAAASAATTPPFTIDPAAVPGVASPTSVTANYLTLTADDLITFSSLSTQSNFTETGVATGVSFETGSGGLVGGTGLNSTYGLWVNFTASGTYVSGSTSPQSYVVTSVNWSLYEDAGAKATIAPGDATTDTPPTISDNGDILYELASGHLAPGLTSTGTVSSAGYGLHLFSTVITNPVYTPPPVGTATTPFFVSPNPFFQLAFDSWSANPSANAVACPDGTQLCVTVNAQSGQFNFLNTPVPEPASLTLLGGGLLGLGVFARRRKKKAAVAT